MRTDQDLNKPAHTIRLLSIQTAQLHRRIHLTESAKLLTDKKKKKTARLCLRIFGFAPHSQSTCLHVGKDILHDLSKVCCTQWIVAEIVTIAPAGEENRTR